MQFTQETSTDAALMPAPSADLPLSKQLSSLEGVLNILDCPKSLTESSLPQSNRELSKLLRVKSSSTLTYASKNKSEHYKLLKIPKKGGYRVVYNPSNLMRLLQFRILKEVLEKYFEIPDYIYAFERDKSIPVMARVHEGSLQVVSLDIKDYFPSIKQHTLKDLMTGVGFGELPARTLSELMTLGPNVPQGGLTSPKISNIVASKTFGPEVKKYCDDRGLSLTIYADDITISSKDSFESLEAIDFVSEVLSRYGFKVNRAKTKIMKKGTRHSRLYVCGTVVNEKVNLLREDRLRLRAIVYNAGKNGLEAEAAKTNLTPNEFMLKIRGKLNWFGQLNPGGSSKLISAFHKACTEWEELCRSTPYQHQAE